MNESLVNDHAYILLRPLEEITDGKLKRKKKKRMGLEWDIWRVNIQEILSS